MFRFEAEPFQTRGIALPDDRAERAEPERQSLRQRLDLIHGTNGSPQKIQSMNDSIPPTARWPAPRGVGAGRVPERVAVGTGRSQAGRS
ncbi:hypothetical protein GCM10027589_37040 [Actinocorallia lasiicapitis]